MKFSMIKLLLLIIVIIGSFVFTFKLLLKKFIKNLDREEYIKYIINDSFGSYKFDNIVSIKYLLKDTFGIEDSKTTSVFKDNKEEFDLETENGIKPNYIDKKPILYIYNTHQGECYRKDFFDTFNIKNTVIVASYILQEYLKSYGIVSIVEENNVADILHANGWKYGASYIASRMLLENSLKENPSLKFFIDIHRDSSKYEKTMTIIDGKKYARYLFVVGLENPGYEANLLYATSLNNMITEKYPTLSRGIMKKKGPRVNGVYNQDVSKNSILIEVGGQYNTIDEVNNTLKIIAPFIAQKIKEENEKEKELVYKNN